MAQVYKSAILLDADGCRAFIPYFEYEAMECWLDLVIACPEAAAREYFNLLSYGKDKLLTYQNPFERDLRLTVNAYPPDKTETDTRFLFPNDWAVTDGLTDLTLSPDLAAVFSAVMQKGEALAVRHYHFVFPVPLQKGAKLHFVLSGEKTFLPVMETLLLPVDGQKINKTFPFQDPVDKTDKKLELLRLRTFPDFIDPVHNVILSYTYTNCKTQLFLLPHLIGGFPQKGHSNVLTETDGKQIYHVFLGCLLELPLKIQLQIQGIAFLGKATAKEIIL